MRVIDRYLLGAFGRIFTLTALTAPLLFVLADLTEHLDAELALGRTMGEILHGYASQFPLYLTWGFPIAALVATLFTLQPLMRHGEIHAMLASGIRVQRLFIPLVLSGVFAALVGLVLLETFPRLLRDASLAPGERAGGAAARESFAYLTDAGEILSVQRLEVGARARMYGVALRSATPTSSRPVQYVVAREARFVEGRGWELRDGNLWTLLPNGEQVSMDFTRLMRPSLTERAVDLLDAPALALDEMTFGELGRLVDRMERSGAPTGYPRTKQWERIAIPLTVVAIILFAAPLATLAGRGEGQLGVALALVCTIFYLALLRTTEGLGAAGILPAGFAALFPALIFGAGGAFLLQRART
jgi:lipopolysaccharide export system permease protein